MINNDTNGTVSGDKRKYLFLRQIETLEGFLRNGAITKAQYEFSYSGLVTKMNITPAELSEWLGNEHKDDKGE